MKEQVGKCAGKIWNLLQKKDEVSITQLPRAIKEKSVDAYQGLGWLAREDKIVYHKKGDKIFVSLVNSERRG